MKFKLSINTWEKINRLNEKYHILSTEVNDYDELDQFFFIFEEINANREDALYVNYIFDLQQLCCYNVYKNKEEFYKEKLKLEKKYYSELENLNNLCCNKI